MIKLSEAILLGSVGTEQGFGDYVDSSGRTCALGAALVAIGKLGKTEFENHSMCSSAWHWPTLVRMECPHKCGKVYTKVSVLIPHLNDDHKWTRPQIAAWVATVEPKDQAPAQTQETLQHVPEPESVNII